MKVVYTVLEAQYQSALTAAVQAINSTNKTVCFELVGYLLEELRDPSNYEAFKKDLQDANVFIGSLIFIEELAEKVSCHDAAHASSMQGSGVSWLRTALAPNSPTSQAAAFNSKHQQCRLVCFS